MFSPKQQGAVYSLISEQALPNSDFTLQSGTELRLTHNHTGFYVRVVPTQMKIATPLNETVVRLLVYSIPSQEGAILTAKKENVSPLFERWEYTIGTLRHWLNWIKGQYYRPSPDGPLEFSSGAASIVVEPRQDNSSLAHLHLTVQQAASSRFASAHYSDAIQKACTALEKAVQVRSGLPVGTAGVSVMTTAFSKNNPLISLASDPNEQFGFMNLYQGTVQALRNHFAHNLTELTDPNRALEWLGFISALFYTLDGAQPTAIQSTP